MALADVFQLTHNMTWQGKSLANMYHVFRANSGEQAQSINDSFANSILPIIRLWQSDSLNNVDIVCFNLDDEEDFHTQSIAAAGFRAVTNSPSFVSPAIKFPSLNRLIRAGQKRHAGSGEGDYTSGSLVAAAVTLLENIGDAMIGNWLASADSHIVGNYIILQRVCDEVDPVTGKCLKYRLPETDGELKFYQPTARIVNTEISSQVSRKVF